MPQMLKMPQLPIFGGGFGGFEDLEDTEALALQAWGRHEASLPMQVCHRLCSHLSLNGSPFLPWRHALDVW